MELAGVGMKDIKRRIKSVESTMQITKAMELVASSKLRKAKEKVEKSRPYFETLYGTMQKIAMESRGIQSVFLREREEGKRGYIVVAGDRGLAGGYNANAVKLALSHMEERPVTILSIGKKSTDFFAKRGYEIAGKYPSTADDIDISDVSEIVARAISMYEKGEIHELYIVYTKFVSGLTQMPQVKKLLPLKFNFEEDGYEPSESEETTKYEPSPEGVFNSLVPRYVSGIVFGAILESFASEQGARRTAMESATDNANEMVESLQLKYNRARQASITQEINEIVSGAEALS